LKKEEDKLLLIQIAKGNKDAFNTLFRKYYQQLVRFALGYTHSGENAEELVQDIMVKLWEQAPALKIEVSLLAYLYTSVRNRALNQIKHEKVIKRYAEQRIAEEKQNQQVDENPVNLSYFRQQLLLALEKLPSRCREIFELAKFEGLSYDEIAQHLGLSAKTVENQMGVALKKLREAMMPVVQTIYES
jgi:RNA polymerase sigma-70 factor (ECF subfamily)